LGAVDYNNLKHVEGIIENGVKETYDDCSNNIARVEGIIRIGEKIN
jgi:5-methylcytosine-specific restriction endonuclease McrBC regulatory subunit McrC